MFDYIEKENRIFVKQFSTRDKQIIIFFQFFEKQFFATCKAKFHFSIVRRNFIYFLKRNLKRAVEHSLHNNTKSEPLDS